MKRWINRCQVSHPDCAWPRDNVLPTRVIDVGSDLEEPFVFESLGTKGEWATLSHSWGGKVPLSTISTTLEQHKSCIPLRDLPQTFRDAVILSRRLAFRYLWIDSLCIVQDSHEDWYSESSQMLRVYADASLNFSAAAAKNAMEGMYQSADRLRRLNTSLASFLSHAQSYGIQGRVYVASTGEGPFIHQQNEPLHKRAWVLQESILSPRRIELASSQLYWGCRTTSHKEGSPDTMDNTVAVSLRGRQLLKLPFVQLADNPNLANSQHPLMWWYAMLYHEYLSRSITKDDDILPALSGVAQFLAQRIGYRYEAGLWLEDMHRGLLVSMAAFPSCPSSMSQNLVSQERART